MNPARLALSVLVLTASACTASKEPAPAAAPAAAAHAEAPAPSAAHAVPAAQPAAAPAGELVFAAQPGWVSEPVTSSMRKAQFRVPGAGGADATLVVYWFGAQGGGGKEANIERWVGQFEQPDGSDSHAVLKSATRTVHGMEVTDIDLAGTYVAETSPGSGVRVREEGWRLLASIIVAPEGAYYAKLVGPAATVAAEAAKYKAFVDGLGG
jgi:hypothetical protein